MRSIEAFNKLRLGSMSLLIGLAYLQIEAWKNVPTGQCIEPEIVASKCLSLQRRILEDSLHFSPIVI